MRPSGPSTQGSSSSMASGPRMVTSGGLATALPAASTRRILRADSIIRVRRLAQPSGSGAGVLPSSTPARASPAILDPRNSAHNSGYSAHARPAETHKCTALGLIYLQNRRSTTELRPHAYLRLESPKQARMSSGLPGDNRTAYEERMISE